MKFSIATVATFAALGLAQQTGNQMQQTGNQMQQTGNQMQQTGNQMQQTGNQMQQSGNQMAAANYQWPVSDFMYRLQGTQEGNTATGPQVMYTDGQNIFFGTQQSHTSPNGQPLVELMVFFDTQGNLDLSRSSPRAQQMMQQNRFLSADQQGAMQLSSQASGKWEFSSRNGNGDMSDVALRFNENQQFLACPVQQQRQQGQDQQRQQQTQQQQGQDQQRQQQTQQQQWAEDERQNLMQQGQQRQGNEQQKRDIRQQQAQDQNLQQVRPQQQQQQQTQQQQTQQQGQQRQNSDMYQVFINNAPCENPIKLSLNGERQNGQAHYSDIILRVIAPSGDIHYSPVYNQNGRLYASSEQRPGQQVNAMRSQLSYQGQLVDTQSRQFATLGQNQQLALTDADNVHMGAKGFSVNNQGYLNFNNLQFLACNAGNNVWEIRPVGAEGAASGCSDGQTVSIRVEQAPRQQQQQTQQQDRDQQRQQQIQDQQRQQQTQQTQDQQRQQQGQQLQQTRPEQNGQEQS
ncbi:hypothetical protein CJU90_0348 [Yarrowia sp. C11]|nr:hypothetical protein CKK34_1759 [Yarrowia sp. E02]KAG5372696.1 hypothetical protein CJU90_0348 [Yarrowia sp. C11]